MRHVTAREANQRFARLLSSVEDGEQVVITKRGKPVAVVSPCRPDLSEERKAAIEHLRKVMSEPVKLRGPFRTFTRDEMHERE
jgi:prevent-host-death family protein